MKKALLTALLFLTGCYGKFDHGDWNGKICVSPDKFSADEEALILKATEEWHTVSKGDVNLQVNYLNNHDLTGCDASFDRKDLSKKEDHPIGLTAIPEFDNDIIFIYITNTLTAPDYNQENAFYSVSLHELGHYLGANHSPRCDDIMYWKFHNIFHLTSNDANQLWDPYPAHKYDNLSFCEETTIQPTP